MIDLLNELHILLISPFFSSRFLLKILDERLAWNAKPKVDSHNEELIGYMKSAPKPIVRSYFDKITQAFLFLKMKDL